MCGRYRRRADKQRIAKWMQTGAAYRSYLEKTWVARQKPRF